RQAWADLAGRHRPLLRPACRSVRDQPGAAPADGSRVASAWPDLADPLDRAGGGAADSAAGPPALFAANRRRATHRAACCHGGDDESRNLSVGHDRDVFALVVGPGLGASAETVAPSAPPGCAEPARTVGG